jgi:hypothetical protein
MIISFWGGLEIAKYGVLGHAPKNVSEPDAKENTNARVVWGIKLLASQSGHCTKVVAYCCPAHRFSNLQATLAALPLRFCIEVGSTVQSQMI